MHFMTSDIKERFVFILPLLLESMLQLLVLTVAINILPVVNTYL
jgi:hypothetical protein